MPVITSAANSVRPCVVAIQAGITTASPPAMACAQLVMM